MTKNKTIKALGLFIVILSLSFGSVTWFTSDILRKQHESQQEYLLNNYNVKQERIINSEWDFLSATLKLSLSQAKVQGQGAVSLVDALVKERFDNNNELIASYLDTYEEPNNPIRIIVTSQVDSLYYNNIKSDNTDGFVTKGALVEADTSENCSTYGTTRSFDLEMLMHANPELALEAFTRIAQGDVDNLDKGALTRPIFFQFVTHPYGIDMQREYHNIPLEHQGKLGIELESYDLKGLEKYFKETNSWENTFRSFEFVTPTYMFNKTDLANRPYIDQGKKTNIPRIAMSVVFNFKTVIDNDPVLTKTLSAFKVQRQQDRLSYERNSKILKEDFLLKERLLYLVVILLMIICFIAMHYTNKLIEDIQD